MGDSGDDEWNRVEEAMRKLKTEDSNTPPPARIVSEGSKEVIDSALLDALDNPRERMNVLKYEDRILRFAQSTDSILDVPPIANAFQRLLIYRVAQRFALDHSASETTNESGDRGILIFKTDHSRIPDVLLIDLQRTVPGETPAVPVPGVTGSADSAKPKIKVMKRSNAHKSNLKKGPAADQGQNTMSDRERAYAEARARIFGTEGADVDAGSPAGVSPPPVATPPARAGSPAAGPVDGGGGAAKAAGRGAERGNKKAVVNTANWTEKKVTIRNKDAERFDPDFARLSSRGPPMGSGFGGGYMGAGGPPPPGPYGQNMPMHPLAPMWGPGGPDGRVMGGGAARGPAGWGDGGPGVYNPPHHSSQSFGSFDYQPHSNYYHAPPEQHPLRPPAESQTGSSVSKTTAAPDSSVPAAYQEAFPPLG